MIGKTIGQYQVIDKIGEGGMGAVYNLTLNPYKARAGCCRPPMSHSQ